MVINLKKNKLTLNIRGQDKKIFNDRLKMFRCLGAKRTLVDMRKKREQSNLIFCLDVGTVETPFCDHSVTSLD